MTRRLRNLRLPERHFRALVRAAESKPFGRRPRKDDSFLNAIGNWLDSDELGAWRNPNRGRPYQADNKALWEKFVSAVGARDYSLRRALED